MNSPETCSVTHTASGVLPLCSADRWSTLPALSLRRDGKFSEVLEFIFVLKQALTPDSQAWYHLCTRDLPSLNISLGLRPSQRAPLPPWANGLFSPSTLMGPCSLCLLWALRSSRISSVQVHKRSFIARGLAHHLLLTKPRKHWSHSRCPETFHSSLFF